MDNLGDQGSLGRRLSYMVDLCNLGALSDLSGVVDLVDMGGLCDLGGLSCLDDLMRIFKAAPLKDF